jgi:hypothetical protein
VTTSAKSEALVYVDPPANPNAWMAKRTKAEMVKYASVKMMPTQMILETWRNERKRAAKG